MEHTMPMRQKSVFFCQIFDIDCNVIIRAMRKWDKRGIYREKRTMDWGTKVKMRLGKAGNRGKEAGEAWGSKRRIDPVKGGPPPPHPQPINRLRFKWNATQDPRYQSWYKLPCLHLNLCRPRIVFPYFDGFPHTQVVFGFASTLALHILHGSKVV